MLMNESEWLACADPERMMDYLPSRASARKLRLLACACCRAALRVIPDGDCREGIDLAERIADKSASDEEVGRFRPTIQSKARMAEEWAINSARSHIRGGWWSREQGPEKYLGYQSGNDALTAAALSLFIQAVGWSLGAAGEWRQSVEAARSAMSQIEYPTEEYLRAVLACLFGNPFRPSPPLPGAVIAWNDRTVPRIAQGIYEERLMGAATLDAARLAILADALLDAGCDNEGLIAHCRSEGLHVMGCWGIDLILGKE
jgi:hypothetical protein